MSAYPDAPGARNTDTSMAAAEAIAPDLGRLQRLTLNAIAERCANGLTADECAAALAMQRWSVQPRLSELRRRGLIIDSGNRRRNCTGKMAIVFVLRKYEQGVGE